MFLIQFDFLITVSVIQMLKWNIFLEQTTKYEKSGISY